MLNPRFLAWLVIAALAFASGCIGAEEPAPATNGSAEEPEGDTPSRPASDPPAAETEAPGNEEPENVTTPLQYEGTTTTAVCASPTVPLAEDTGHCPLLTEGRNAVMPLEAPGAVTAVTATVTWTPTTPLTESLLVTLLVDEGSGYAWNASVLESGYYVESSGSIDVDWSLAGFAPDARFALYVGNWVDASATPAAHAGAELPQDFTVDGRVESAPT